MVSLLPASSGLFETALEASIDPRWPILAAGADVIRGAKLVDPPASFLPFLVYEYGLGELTPYVPNLYTLVIRREGIDWQRVRGTPAAVAKGLDWLGYAAALEDAWFGRVFWNSTQLRFTTLPLNDLPDLERIEGVTGLSLPLRSRLRRGVYQYDAGALVGDWLRLDDSMLERESGTSVTAAGTLWSFGRRTEIAHVLTEDEGTAIGNWIDIPDDPVLRWSTMQYPWATATFSWSSDAHSQRRSVMAAWFNGKLLFATLRDVDGAVIGHRRCRACWSVIESADGRYTFGSAGYRALEGAGKVYIEAMTDFDDAFDIGAKAVELTVGASVLTGTKPGKLWLEPEELVGGHPIAVTAVDLPLRKTVREQLKFLVTF